MITPLPLPARLCAAAVVISLAASCTTTSYRVASYTRRYGDEVFPRTDAVEVFEEGRPPARAYRAIGAIDIAGGPDTDEADLIEAAVEHARELGADAIVELSVRLDEPHHVKDHRKTTISAGRTALAIIGGVLVWSRLP